MALPLKTVVLVDDDPLVLRVLQAHIQELGYICVGTASDGRSGLALIQREKPNVAFVDVQMPEMDGLQVATEVAKIGTTAVVIITGDLSAEVSRKAMEAGASAYLQKPFDMSQVGAVVESAWHHFQTVHTLQEQTRHLNEVLEMRKIVEKAKGILMEQQGYSEEEAHKTLQKMSQDQGLPLQDVCRAVIQVRMVLGKSSKTASSRSQKPAA